MNLPKRIFIVGISMLMWNNQSHAQSNYIVDSKLNSSQEAVMQTALNLLEGIRNSDTVLFKSAFVANPDLAVVYKDATGKDRFQKNNFKEFIGSVGKEKSQVWDEVIWNVDIRIDDKLAVMSCDYAFYLGRKFHHCGMDVFVMHQVDGSWKVFQLSDTRKDEGCKVPKELRKGRDL
ncbi:nuclear transport factor 2 family protein [Luteibaculum oceani]|uniref:Nuclear transport factor 2 family protein n=1 Tax=Luteibaculum oceani TaxID=1294296 RepID=A0A5C6UYD2_9FLAO|nr:nuclear transport factor 2 family protein [Luteibaculum oceani]TXC75645.1 nuclear transport factor 2 family protein [Luteibaculum oceani]